MDASLMARLNENRRLKKMYTKERLKAEIIAEAMAKSGDAISSSSDGGQGRDPLRDFHSLGLPDIQGQRGLLSLSAGAGR